MSERRTAEDHRRFIPDDMKPNDAYILGQRDRYRRDREPDIKCRNCGQPWAIEAEAAAPDVTIMRKAMLDLDRILPGPKPRYSWPTAAQIVAAYERARLMRERQP